MRIARKGRTFGAALAAALTVAALGWLTTPPAEAHSSAGLELESSTAGGGGETHASSSAWVDIGYGLAGSGGVPSLTGDGVLVRGSTLTFSIQGARSNALGLHLFGWIPMRRAALGGTLIVLPMLVRPFLTDSSGSWVGSTTLSEDYSSSSGVSCYLQSIIRDRDAPQGWSMTNGIRKRIP